MSVTAGPSSRAKALGRDDNCNNGMTLENQHFLSFLCPISQVIQGSALHTFHQRLVVNPARLQTGAACGYGDALANKHSQHLLHVVGSVGWRLPPQANHDAIAEEEDCNLRMVRGQRTHQPKGVISTLA